jgi:tripartite-type tricarboxylate transporter receptor subunit TctC
MEENSIARGISSTISRRDFARRLAAGSIVLSALEAKAQSAGCGGLQGKSLRWIVPNLPGGGYDVYSRLLAPHLEKVLGVKVRVDNVAGASGVRAARVLRDAPADGLTVAIMNSAALMMASLSDSAVPSPAEDFTILGRIARSQHVWVTGASSGIRSMEDVFRIADERGVVIGTTTVGALNFAETAVTSALLGVRADFVAGYPGSRQTTLAAIRGEVDLVGFSATSILDRLQSGDLRPLLQISAYPITGLPSGETIPCLAGPNGLARRRAAAAGRDPERSAAEAAALVDFVGAGRIVVAPLGLAPELRDCLGQGICEALGSLAASNPKRSTDTACAAAAREDVQAARARAEELLPMVREAAKRTRNGGL